MMMRHILAAGVAALLAGPWLSGPAALAQGRPSGGAMITGTVRDGVSGRTLARTQVCADLPDSRAILWRRCAAIDSSAVFRLDSLPAGTWRVQVFCGTVRLYSKVIASESIAVSAAAPVRRDWTVDPAGCDPRPLRRISGVFRGYYAVGYEVSGFVPCVADAWFVPSDSVKIKGLDQRSAWAVQAHARVPEAFRWPKIPPDRWGMAHYYVHWRGTVVGPGHYGHFGGSAFALHVDSILELRAVREGDCPSIQGPRRRSESKHIPPRAHPTYVGRDGLIWTSGWRRLPHARKLQACPREVRIAWMISEVKKAIRKGSARAGPIRHPATSGA